MTNTIRALQSAIDFIEEVHGRHGVTLLDEAVLTECKAALAEIEKCEPVADKQTPYSNCQFQICDLPGQCRGEGKCHHPAYPSPQPRDWVGLSYDEIESLYDGGSWHEFANAISEKLKQLNTKG